jgi:putative proteasome-type protease
MDSTIRSNLSVGLPLDFLSYQRDALRVQRHVLIDANDPYYSTIHARWGSELRRVFSELPNPTWAR